MVVLFTGISGIRITESLSKFSLEYKKFKPGGSYYGKQPIVIKMDNEIEKIYLESTKEPQTKRIWINKILLLPYGELKNYWNEAMDRISNRISVQMKENPEAHIFVNLHSCYFHNRTQEYLSLVDFKRIQSINPEMVITLIDDIYDIHTRLNDLGGIYHDYTSPNHTDMILRYFSLLDWRAKETMVSKLLANEIGRDHYILAVKHSYTTLFNLVYKKRKNTYLSHPITEVRRLEKEDVSEADKIKGEINNLANSLSNMLTTFLPTTIDEYRITSEISDGNEKKVVYPKLTKRWDEEKYENQGDFLFRVPVYQKDKNSLISAHSLDNTDSETKLSHLLSALSNRISNQVTTRDYSLVEQSDILIIYRPFFNGNASGGVQEEFRYYNELEKNLCFIYCPTNDIHKFYSKQLNYQIRYHIKETKRLKYKLNEAEEFNDKIWENKNTEEIFSSKEQLLEFIDELFDGKIVFNEFPESRVPLGPDELKNFKNSFSESLILSFSLVKNYQEKSYFESDDLTVDEWVNKIYKHLNI